MGKQPLKLFFVRYKYSYIDSFGIPAVREMEYPVKAHSVQQAVDGMLKTDLFIPLGTSIEVTYSNKTYKFIVGIDRDEVRGIDVSNTRQDEE